MVYQQRKEHLLSCTRLSCCIRNFIGARHTGTGALLTTAAHVAIAIDL